MSHGIKRAYATGRAKPRRKKRADVRISDINKKYNRNKARRMKQRQSGDFR